MCSPTRLDTRVFWQVNQFLSNIFKGDTICLVNRVDVMWPNVIWLLFCYLVKGTIYDIIIQILLMRDNITQGNNPG